MKNLSLNDSGQVEAGELKTADISDARYIHVQEVPAETWTITHNLNRTVSVTLYNEAGVETEASVVTDVNNAYVTFAYAIRGTAICI